MDNNKSSLKRQQKHVISIGSEPHTHTKQSPIGKESNNILTGQNKTADRWLLYFNVDKDDE